MAHELSIIEQFDAQHGRYCEFCERIGVLLGQLLKTQGIPVHSISGRVKTRDSYIKKIGQKGTSYRSIGDVTDVAGVRVITYFSDQVDEVASVVKDEFEVDLKNSIDKREILDPDRFGYLSLHYIVSLSAARCSLAEYRAFSGLKAEIQIRSILQHAWAEIEHDLGYKTSGEVPRSVKRQFARLASLLELADDEFVKIRADLDAYSREVSAKIAEHPNDVCLDRISLIDFARADALVSRLDLAIAANLGYSFQPNEDSIASEVDKLQFFGLQTIADVKSALEKHQNHIISLSKRWSAGKEEPVPGDTVSEGISLFYLCHVLAGASQNVYQAISYLKAFNIGDEREETARDLVQFMKDQLSSTTG